MLGTQPVTGASEAMPVEIKPILSAAHPGSDRMGELDDAALEKGAFVTSDAFRSALLGVLSRD